MARTFLYRVTWRGPWDGKDRPPRIISPLEARNKQHAAELHERLFPAATRKIERVKK